jgi:glycosyltransferase involved in cell wall biosynthesis
MSGHSVPIVSVIIPAYNCEQAIARAIQSGLKCLT